jgi:hypothetical protein
MSPPHSLTWRLTSSCEATKGEQLAARGAAAGRGAAAARGRRRRGGGGRIYYYYGGTGLLGPGPGTRGAIYYANRRRTRSTVSYGGGGGRRHAPCGHTGYAPRGCIA